MISNKMSDFEFRPKLPEICTEIFVYAKARAIKHIKAPAIVKVDLTNLFKNRLSDNED